MKVREKYIESDFGVLVMPFYIAHSLQRKSPGIDYVLLNNYDKADNYVHGIRLHCFILYEIRWLWKFRKRLLKTYKGETKTLKKEKRRKERKKVLLLEPIEFIGGYFLWRYGIHIMSKLPFVFLRRVAGNYTYFIRHDTASNP